MIYLLGTWQLITFGLQFLKNYRRFNFGIGYSELVISNDIGNGAFVSCFILPPQYLPKPNFPTYLMKNLIAGGKYLLPLNDQAK